ncbi:MAG TPA: 1-(5-phosphoribosyl)-5-[(5-phosphoribosylamino)methylideneamino]imidazole-4-carboxamide isomerase [Ktedonobacteraceae bacterium]|nr:1-(5-phosphoribosyl)-5-[(5-phosphoribosylamino)methylideneamino]imidazole-4-carboxamide isomerase [Ktedonobacteraceae bacterium]
MIIFPAIDIKDGQCVRLYQGDYARVTTYDADPVQVALRWQQAGAKWLHVVDLDGAARGEPVNLALIGAIRAATSLHVEVGGGLRSLEHIEQVLALGVERVILGTIALTDRALLENAVQRWGERIVVGLDARDGLVAISGWRETSAVQATVLAGELCEAGVRRFIYTDIARDGALSGPNLPALQEMQRAISSATEKASYSHKTTFQPESCLLIASGGVHSLDDVRDIAKLGIEGAIIGKVLYTGAIDLAEAIREYER